MVIQLFSIGWNDREQLIWDTNKIQYNHINPDGSKTTLECDMCSKTMQFANETPNYDIEKSVICILNSNGERWEGDVCNNLPFGYGSLYNSDGVLSYLGFMYNGDKSCFGNEYYPDGETIQYSGTYMNGKRHGYGKLYDKKGKVIFEGSWCFDQYLSFCINVPSNCETDEFIHNQVTQLIIGNHCYCGMTHLLISDYVSLFECKIGPYSFKNVRVVSIKNCGELHKLSIGNNCFGGDNGSLTISNCVQLMEIKIGHSSFTYYSTCQLTGIGSVVFVPRSSIITRNAHREFFHGISFKLLLLS